MTEYETNTSSGIQTPGDTIGDRLIAASLFIGCARASVVNHPGFPEASKNGGIVELLRDMEELSARVCGMLKQWPAGAMEKGESAEG